MKFAHADYEHNGPLVIGAVNRNGSGLESSVETTDADRMGFTPATIKVNGIAQDYLKFECRAFSAG